ncbi:MAG: AAA family ATPase [Chloroflexota bacterium]
MQKIIIVGTTGAGKSTLARQLTQKLNITQIELDALFWNENWQPTPDYEFRARVTRAMANASAEWVMDGNYSRVRDITWQQADTVIWLNYSLYIIYWRIITRTLKRVVTRKKLWGKNRETFRNAFLSKDSIIWWAHSTYHQRKELYNRLIASGDYPHINFVVFKHPRETESWLNSFPNAQ